jgi:hypothetical protein
MRSFLIFCSWCLHLQQPTAYSITVARSGIFGWKDAFSAGKKVASATQSCHLGLFLNTCNLKCQLSHLFIEASRTFSVCLLFHCAGDVVFTWDEKVPLQPLFKNIGEKLAIQKGGFQLPFRHFLRISPQESFSLSARIAMGWKCHLSACYCIYWKQMAHWCLSVGQLVLLYARSEVGPHVNRGQIQRPWLGDKVDSGIVLRSTLA